MCKQKYCPITEIRSTLPFWGGLAKDEAKADKIWAKYNLGKKSKKYLKFLTG